jgi:hypothetical protein
METKEELKNKLWEIEQQEARDKKEKQLQANYEAFKNRGQDWVIGRAHAESRFKDNGWHHPKGIQMPLTVSIRGNVGHTYIPTASVTEATMTYFHNVWENEDRHAFEKALEELVQQEVERIAKKLQNVLEILGLQSNAYHIQESYPKDKQEEVAKDVWDETVKVLDTYPDKDFEAMKNVQLSHSAHILHRYLKEKRPHLTNQ